MRSAVFAIALALAFGAASAKGPIKGNRSGPYSATLTWNVAANAMDGGTAPAFTGYYIKYDTVSRKAGGAYAYRYFVTGGASTTGTVTGLVAGTFYFVVVPFDGINEGAADMEWSKTQP